MTPEQIDYRYLESFYRLVMIRIWLRRIRLIIVRVVILAAVSFVLFLMIRFAMSDDQSVSYSSNEGSLSYSGDIDLGFLVVLAFSLYFGFLYMLHNYWSKFAQSNNFKLINPQTGINAPISHSFAPKRAIGFQYIAMPVRGQTLYLQSYLYKEGGVLRWREYKLDTALWLELPTDVTLPHIIADATTLDKARLSNLRRKMDEVSIFNAEGEAGKRYRLLTRKNNEIDALAIFTPEVLQAMLATMPDADIEIKDNKIWFIRRRMKLNSTTMPDFINAALTVFPEIEKQSRPYKR